VVVAVIFASLRAALPRRPRAASAGVRNSDVAPQIGRERIGGKILRRKPAGCAKAKGRHSVVSAAANRERPPICNRPLRVTCVPFLPWNPQNPRIWSRWPKYRVGYKLIDGHTTRAQTASPRWEQFSGQGSCLSMVLSDST